jgi:hypothetical protein
MIALRAAVQTEILLFSNSERKATPTLTLYDANRTINSQFLADSFRTVQRTVPVI